MREITVEHALVIAVRKRGGMCLKFVSPGTAGVPDRLVLLPKGKSAFVETKAPGRKPRRLQEVRHAQLRDLGHPVYVVDHPDQIEGILDEIQAA